MATIGDEENAAELEFGAEFASSNNVQCLSNDEVYFLLSKKAPGGFGTMETFQQTYSYLEKVATSKIADDLSGMATEIATQLQLLELELKVNRKRVNLHQFEIKSLANLLRPGEVTPEEALSWIPSLSRFDDEEIMKALNIVVSAKERVVEGAM